MNSNSPMECEKDRQLDELLNAYRSACPDFEPGASFMPGIWARIDEREVSTNWFGRIAKTLVTAAVAASAILALMLSSFNHQTFNHQAAEFLNGTFVEALRADQVAELEPFHVDHIAELEQQ